MNSDEDMSFSESNKPFANNYIKYKVTGYYYEISKVVSGCEHAGPGSNMNERFLHFFGADGNLNPTGLRVFYHTPSWEGIDSNGTRELTSCHLLPVHGNIMQWVGVTEGNSIFMKAVSLKLRLISPIPYMILMMMKSNYMW